MGKKTGTIRERSSNDGVEISMKDGYLVKLVYSTIHNCGDKPTKCLVQCSI